MTQLIPLLGACCAVLLAVHFVSVAIAVVRIRASASASCRDDGESVSIIRPVCGLDNFVEETLLSSFALAHPNYEVLFCVAHDGDPAVPLVQRLIALHRHVPARLLIGNNAISDNPKLNNIVKGWAAARHDLIIMADSNVLMPRDYIQRLIAAGRPDTGLVCSPPIGCAPQTLSAEIECGFLNTHQARWQYVADALGIGFAQGKTMLWRRQFLEAAGGMRALASEAAEDAAATKLVRRAGLRVRLVGVPFPQPLGRRRFSEVWRRQLRWARLRRDTFKVFFIPELFTGALLPFALCLASAAAADWSLAATALSFMAAWYGAEVALASAAGWQLSYLSVPAWMLRDLLLPLLWVASWMGDDFVWRGNVMHVANRGSSA